MPLSSESCGPLSLDCSIPNLKAIRSFETLLKFLINHTAQHPRILNLQLVACCFMKEHSAFLPEGFLLQ